MSRWAQGQYVVRHPEKYVGKSTPRYRSGWELAFMKFCDDNDNVLQWASESIAIPYRHPLTGKMTQYIPDFLITYRTRNNQVKAELIEIKPKGQSIVEEKMNALVSDPGAVLKDMFNISKISLSNLGSDMTDDQREKAQEVVIPVILVSNIVASVGSVLTRRL